MVERHATVLLPACVAAVVAARSAGATHYRGVTLGASCRGGARPSPTW